MNAVTVPTEHDTSATGKFSFDSGRDLAVLSSDAATSTKIGATTGGALSAVFLAAALSTSPHSSAELARALESNTKPNVWLGGTHSRRSDAERLFPVITQSTETGGGSPEFGAAPLVLLVLEVLHHFPSALYSLRIVQDPDEGWSKRALEVRTGVTDVNARMQVEDRFFERADNSPGLRAALQQFIVLFE